MKEKRETVYVKAERNSVCHDPQIRIMDVMSVECTDPAICAGIKNKTLYHFAPEQTMETLKIVVLCIVIFLGSAFTIMAFNNDVSVGEVFDRFYKQILGGDKPTVSEIEIFYCLGLAVGILVFFNHIGKKKITSDPTPIQVEMRKYQKDVDTTFIENAGRRGHEHDVN